ncbi:hscarg dehydrogenase [Stagonosporopsis vannaccii]|nr:hscarg dehydrogenase [Stagonosporopsis vannaccii]
MKLIVVTGATGAQGGGVANVMLETPGWNVRAVTRDTNSAKAKDLATRGAEVVQADFNDVESLVAAFKGAHAIYGVTNFWEHLFAGKSLEEAGIIEEEQGINLARAAARTASLEHYLWSTLVGAKMPNDRKILCAHVDFKEKVNIRMQAEFPELAKKTTYLMFGWYSSNQAVYPSLKPFELPGSDGKFVQLLPTRGDTTIPVTGDISVTAGIWVRQALALPNVSKGRYTVVATEFLSYHDMAKMWSEVTGRTALHVKCSVEDYARLYGDFGKDLAAQLLYGEVIEDWNKWTPNLISKEELGIANNEVPGHKVTLERFRKSL